MNKSHVRCCHASGFSILFRLMTQKTVVRLVRQRLLSLSLSAVVIRHTHGARQNIKRERRREGRKKNPFQLFSFSTLYRYIFKFSYFLRRTFAEEKNNTRSFSFLTTIASLLIGFSHHFAIICSCTRHTHTHTQEVDWFLVSSAFIRQARVSDFVEGQPYRATHDVIKSNKRRT